MHIIDEVLVPLTPKPPNSEIDNIDALEFMRSADKIDLGGHNLRTYRSQVSLAKKESLFQAPGGHTFLVPVDAGFKVCCSLYFTVRSFRLIHPFISCRFPHAAIWLMAKLSMVTLFQTVSFSLPPLRRMNPVLPPPLRINSRLQSASSSRRMERVCAKKGSRLLLQNIKVSSLSFSVCQIEYSCWGWKASNWRCAGRDCQGKHSSEEWSCSLGSPSSDDHRHHRDTVSAGK